MANASYYIHPMFQQGMSNSSRNSQLLTESNNNAANFSAPSEASCLQGGSSSQMLLATAPGLPLSLPLVGTLPSAGSRGTLPSAGGSSGGRQSRLGLGVPLPLLYAQQPQFEANPHYSAVPYSDYERGGPSVSAAGSPMHVGEPQAKAGYFMDNGERTPHLLLLIERNRPHLFGGARAKPVIT